MDKKIRKIEKEVSRGHKKEAEKELHSLEKMDKKRDKMVEKAKKMKK